MSLLIIGGTTSEFFPRCVQYWPAAKNREEVYGGVGITVESEEQLANFMIRFVLSLELDSDPYFCFLQNDCVEEGRRREKGDPVMITIKD